MASNFVGYHNDIDVYYILASTLGLVLTSTTDYYNIYNALITARPKVIVVTQSVPAEDSVLGACRENNPNNRKIISLCVVTATRGETSSTNKSH